MKRILYVILFLSFVFVLKSKAQLYVGPVAGASVSKVYFFDSQPTFKSNATFGFDGGIMASMSVRKNFRLNAQLLYAQRSRKILGTSAPHGDPKFDLSANMKYIELPIFYALEFKKVSGAEGSDGGRKTYNWYVGAGPVISYWLSTKGRLKSSNLSEVQIDHIDYTGKFVGNSDAQPEAGKEIIPNANRLQLGLNLTAGFAFEPAASRKIMASVSLVFMQTFLGRSDGTFPPTNLGPDTDDIDVMKSRNHSIRFSVGYLIDTKLEKRKRGKSTSKLTNKRRR